MSIIWAIFVVFISFIIGMIWESRKLAMDHICEECGVDCDECGCFEDDG